MNTSMSKAYDAHAYATVFYGAGAFFSLLSFSLKLLTNLYGNIVK
jgi:hypothetical protein